MASGGSARLGGGLPTGAAPAKGRGGRSSQGDHADLARRYGYFLDFLKRRGDLDPFAPAASQVTPAAIETFQSELAGRVGGVTLAQTVYKVRRASELLAPDRDFAWLAEIEKDLALLARPKSKFSRVVEADRLVEAGLALIEEARQRADASDLDRAMRLDQRIQRLQREGAGADLIGERRQAEIDAFTAKALALSIERLMLTELLEQDHRQQVRAGEAARRNMERRRRLRDRLALASGRVKPCIDRVLPFSRAAEGHAAMERRDTVGRIILSGWD